MSACGCCGRPGAGEALGSGVGSGFSGLKKNSEALTIPTRSMVPAIIINLLFPKDGNLKGFPCSGVSSSSSKDSNSPGLSGDSLEDAAENPDGILSGLRRGGSGCVGFGVSSGFGPEGVPSGRV